MRRRSRRARRIVVSTRRKGSGGKYIITYKYPNNTKVEIRVKFPEKLEKITRMFRNYLKAQGISESTATHYVRAVRLLFAHYKRYPAENEVIEFALMYKVHGGASVLEAWELFQKYLKDLDLADEVQGDGVVINPLW